MLIKPAAHCGISERRKFARRRGFTLASDVRYRIKQVVEVREANVPNYRHAYDRKEAPRFATLDE